MCAYVRACVRVCVCRCVEYAVLNVQQLEVQVKAHVHPWNMLCSSLSARALAALQSQVDALTEETQSLREQVRPPPEVPGDRYELLRLLDRRQLEVTRLTGELWEHVCVVCGGG